MSLLRTPCVLLRERLERPRLDAQVLHVPLHGDEIEDHPCGDDRGEHTRENSERECDREPLDGAGPEPMIDKTLKEIFKEIGTKAIYNYIEKKYQLEREKIARNPKTFSTGLKALLGSAAPVIEILIISKLHRELHLKFEKKENVDFSDYIMELRR